MTPTFTRLPKEAHLIREVLSILLILTITGCYAGQSQQDTVRPAAYAGKFYPENSSRLKQQLDSYFSSSGKNSTMLTRGLVVPHAGYVFSGKVAASAYHQLAPDRQIQNIFFLAPAHHVSINKASIYKGDAYQTPLGKIEVNKKIAGKLLGHQKLFMSNERAHRQEHSIEVQLPFLQHHLKNSFRIVPILINYHDKDKIKKVAQALKPYYNPKNLFVVSTDFSHYPKAKDATKVDSLTAKAIASGNPEKLAQQIQLNRQKNISNLKTSMCGHSGMKVMLHLIQQQSHKITPLLYQNSAMSIYGDKNRVVGYWAMQITESNKSEKPRGHSFHFTPAEKRKMLHLARQTIKTVLNEHKKPRINMDTLPEILQKKTGCFVTLHKNGQLRGCMGNLKGKEPLAKAIQDLAIEAAMNDPRFTKVSKNELSAIAIEISVLTPLQPIQSLKEFNLGKEGIYIKKGSRSGVYLPQVAKIRDWTKKEFVSNCSRRKARLGKDGWKDARLYTFRAIVFSEKTVSHEDN